MLRACIAIVALAVLLAAAPTKAAGDTPEDGTKETGGPDVTKLPEGWKVGAALSVLQERRFEDGPLDRANEIVFLLDKYRRR